MYPFVQTQNQSPIRDPEMLSRHSHVARTCLQKHPVPCQADPQRCVMVQVLRQACPPVRSKVLNHQYRRRQVSRQTGERLLQSINATCRCADDNNLLNYLCMLSHVSKI